MSQYGTLQDLATFGLGSAALSSISNDDKTAALVAASDEIDSYVRGANKPPLVPANARRLAQVCCQIALWNLLSSRRGFNPASSGTDSAIERNYLRAIEWLKDVAKGVASLPADADASPGVADFACEAWGDSGRGFDNGDATGETLL